MSTEGTSKEHAMVASEIRWLLRELPGLTRHGVIAPEAAERLRAHYTSQASRKTGTVLIAIFGVLGAVLVASGLILLFAHNWDELSIGARTALAFTPLVLAQGLAVWARLRRAESTAWQEGAASFLALCIGGCIALVSQIYQLPLSLGELLLTWSVLALPLVYLLDSRVTVTLYWIGITSWIYSGHTEIVAMESVLTYAVLAGLSVPFLLGLGDRRGLLSRLSLPAWIVSLCFIAGAFRVTWGAPNVLWVVLVAGMFGALCGVASRLDASESLWRGPFRKIGAIGIAIGVVIVSYRDVWKELMNTLLDDGLFYGRTAPELPTILTAMGLGFALVAIAVPAGLRLLRDHRWHEAAMALAIVPVTIGLALGLVDESFTASALAMNLFGITLGLLTCRDGLRQGHLGTANFGLLIASAVLAARFFDVDWSFVVRGTGFVALGVVFLATNLRLLTRRKEVAA
jgi:hypothetical protein